jgi:3-hydroxybutyryl-CoA dehydrogenase
MKIESVGIVGAGAMGNGIAQIAAIARLKIVLIDITEAALTKDLRCPIPFINQTRN